jgi:hypothetical protein
MSEFMLYSQVKSMEKPLARTAGRYLPPLPHHCSHYTIRARFRIDVTQVFHVELFCLLMQINPSVRTPALAYVKLESNGTSTLAAGGLGCRKKVAVAGFHSSFSHT